LFDFSGSFGSSGGVAGAVVAVFGVVGEGADLLVTQVGSPDPVPAGESLTYEITINNLGSMDALNVSLTDSLPGRAFCLLHSGRSYLFACLGVLCPAAWALCPRSNNRRYILVQVDPAAIGPLINQVDISSSTYDPDLTNNQSIDTTTVIYPPIYP
jgi:hypothetical protein